MRALTILTTTGLACLISVSNSCADTGGHGTDILHWNVRKSFTNDDTNSSATAWVDLKQNKQGKANNQRVDLRIRSLDTNAPYQLWAMTGDDTNYAHASDLTTDSNGNAKMRFMSVGSAQGNGHGHGNGNGRGKNQLPAALNPISALQSLAVGNMNTQAVLTANLLAPDKLQYLVKRHLSNGDVSGDLRIKSTISKLQFKLSFSGLASTNSYDLAVNGAVVSSGSSTTNGTLVFNSLPVAPVDILTVESLALIDSATNTVLSTKLP